MGVVDSSDRNKTSEEIKKMVEMNAEKEDVKTAEAGSPTKEKFEPESRVDGADAG